MNCKSFIMMTLIIALLFDIQKTEGITDVLCNVGDCLEANLLCSPDGAIGIEVDVDGIVDLNAEAMLSLLQESRPSLQLSAAVVTPSSFNCKVDISVPIIINATDDNGNCYVQELIAFADDLIPPVIEVPTEVHIPACTCNSLFGGLCYLDLLDAIPLANVTDNCLGSPLSLSGTISSALDLVGDLLHLPFVSLGCYNVTYNYCDEMGNELNVFSLVHVEGIQIINPLPFTLYLLNSILQTTISISYQFYSSIDTEVHLYLRSVTTGTVGLAADLESYVFVGVYSVGDTIRVSSDVIIDALSSANLNSGSYYLTLYLPGCGALSVRDPIVTLLF